MAVTKRPAAAKKGVQREQCGTPAWSVESFPPHPTRSKCTFLDDLKTPIHSGMVWGRTCAKSGEVNLAGGVTLQRSFPDPRGLLQTAFEDFDRFLSAAHIPNDGAYRIRFQLRGMKVPESHRIVIGRKECRVDAGDTEGVRRALVFLEDLMLRADGPFLPLGRIERKPIIRTRIRWACFGKKPEDYPDEYLNRIAHDGGNALGISASFRDLCPSRIIPEFGKDSARRLADLQQLVQHCLRYGIRVFLYINEPFAFTADDPVLAAHPELVGHRVGKRVYFCTSGKMGQAYLKEAVTNLFKAVPDLGGLFDITAGERPTYCYSGGIKKDFPNNCPRCSSREPEEVLAEMLSIMADAMHAVTPDAVMISWPYTQYGIWGEERAAASAGLMPTSAAIMYNFESAGRAKQLGKLRFADDYWLSYVGPSEFFRQCARNAVAHGNRMFAKLTVAASHEVGTTDCIPVPGILHEKYAAMRELGVSGAFETWDFGNYPSLMTRAAGMLSFDPPAKSRDAFLNDLARRDWAAVAPRVVRAWKHFDRGYRNVPMNILFSYFGPLHDGPVWPLYLKPRDTVLAPKWHFGEPRVDGDRIGECVTYLHTLDEDIILCRRLVDNWKRGVAILRGIENHCRGDAVRQKQIRTARALGLQFESALNILRFYDMREKLFRAQPKQQPALLDDMRAVVLRELEIDRELLPLTEEDSHLGFHPECHGHRYFPAAIRWRIAQLVELLAGDFRKVAQDIRRRKDLFPEYTGKRPTGPACHCRRSRIPAGKASWTGDTFWEKVPWETCTHDGFRHAGEPDFLHGTPPKGYTTAWQCARDAKSLFLRVSCSLPAGTQPAATGTDRARLEPLSNDLVVVRIEPKRLWPTMDFTVNADGARFMVQPGRYFDLTYRWQVRTQRTDKGWQAALRIPFRQLDFPGVPQWPLRINVGRQAPDVERSGFNFFFWIPRRPLPSRLVWNTDNPKDLGWLLFD